MILYILWLKTTVKKNNSKQYACSCMFIHNPDVPVNLHTGNMYFNPVKHCSPISQGHCFQRIYPNQLTAMKKSKEEGEQIEIQYRTHKACM